MAGRPGRFLLLALLATLCQGCLTSGAIERAKGTIVPFEVVAIDRASLRPDGSVVLCASVRDAGESRSVEVVVPPRMSSGVTARRRDTRCLRSDVSDVTIVRSPRCFPAVCDPRAGAREGKPIEVVLERPGRSVEDPVVLVRDTEPVRNLSLLFPPGGGLADEIHVFFEPTNRRRPLWYAVVPLAAVADFVLAPLETIWVVKTLGH